MIVDNWKYLRDKLDFSNSDKFYMIQLQQRKKDDASFPANNRTIKTYFISSLKEYLSLENEIKKLSDETKSRVYIRLNRRSYEDVALEVNKDLAQILKDKNFQHLKNLVPSSAGKVCSEEKRTWIIDLDDVSNEKKEAIMALIDSIEPYLENTKILFKVPTLHGEHLITTPFKVSTFKWEFPDIDIHKDNPTLLYFNPDAHKPIQSTD